MLYYILYQCNISNLKYQLLWSAIKYDLIGKYYERRKNVSVLLIWIIFEWNICHFPYTDKSCMFSLNNHLRTYDWKVFNSKGVNSYYALKKTLWSFCIIMINLSVIIFWLMIPYTFNIDIPIHSSSQRNWHKLPSLLLEILYE